MRACLQFGRGHVALSCSRGGRLKVKPRHDPELIAEKYADRAGDLAAVIIHDDRIGPYLEAGLKAVGERILQVDVPVSIGDPEEWKLEEILIPMHSRIRLSFGGLRKIAISLVNSLGAFQDALAQNGVEGEKPKVPRIVFDTRIDRGYRYCERLLLDGPPFNQGKVDDFFKVVRMARYVGVVRLETLDLGSFDVLADTTSTPTNLNFLAVVVRGSATELTKSAAALLAEECQCGAYFLGPDGEGPVYI